MAVEQHTPDATLVLVEKVTALTAQLAGIASTNEALRQKGVHEVPHDSAVYDPDKDGPRAKLKVASFFQNGGRVNTDNLSNAEITLINQLRPGVYNGKKWTVRATSGGGIDLLYKNKKIGDRITLSADAARGGGGLEGILKIILTEQEANDEGQPAARRGAAR